MEINRNLFVELLELNRSTLTLPDSSLGTLNIYTYRDKARFDSFFTEKRIEKVGDIKKDTIAVLKDDGRLVEYWYLRKRHCFYFMDLLLRKSHIQI